MIERHHLRILCELEKQGSLTAAAKTLCLTQSALTHTIKKLEHQLGTRLWHKDGRGLKFTQAGDYLLAEAKRLLPQMRNLDEVMQQIASGKKGSLRIGMECHPCYQWLLRLLQPYLQEWPQVDVDVKQRFQFGGMAALFNREIDILVTPDPLHRKGVRFTPVFDYEQVLVVGLQHPLASKAYVMPKDLNHHQLFSYPVSTERLDIYNQFLLPANCRPRQHKTVETTEIMLQMVEAGRGVATLPQWLVTELAETFAVKAVRLGHKGIQKQIHLGTRDDADQTDYLRAFIELALRPQAGPTEQPY
ncbi:LysR family transcriptional regulator [Teredinibacter haidensis]|uniref:LysR family transcriptional regulator n=1 Tax=Teredinibacter haidensis TaxID=2731755 RepID=UPI000949051C|nr:LysR family transcriptional regulator [Teredinibacter haidensis]